jgi:hypothetical protein
MLTCNICREWNFPESVTRAIEEQGGMHKGAPLSPLGRLLSLTDYLGKVRVLVEHGQFAASDATLFNGLPPNAAQCYQALEVTDEAQP